MTGKTLCKISGAAESAHLCNFADGHACILQQRPRILQAFFLQKKLTECTFSCVAMTI